MIRRGFLPGVLLSALVLPSAAGSVPTPLDFEGRLAAQQAIERVYYSHQVGTDEPFEKSIPRATLERQVRLYLDQSAALERLWGTPVTAAMLAAEMDRIARDTRFPERLSEIYAALGNDPFLVQECFARPVLVDRLARAAFARDGAMQRLARAGAKSLRLDWSAWWAETEALRSGWEAIEPVASPDAPLPPPRSLARTSAAGTGAGASIESACAADDTWEAIAAPVPALAGRSDHTAIWTGTKMIVWGGWIGGVATQSGGRYDPLTDSWSPTSTVVAPSSRFVHTAVWTGSRMIVWGGADSSIQELATGGRYDPSTDTWQPTSTGAGLPTGRIRHTAVWTGSEMIVWGGSPWYLATGARYNPVSNTWKPMTAVNAPAGRERHVAVWTGTRMIVWGGENALPPLASGSAYDPAADAWDPISSLGPPASRRTHTVVWTGSEMLVWGSSTGSGRYRPASDTWLPISTLGEPTPRAGHSAVWAGGEMVIWGGNYANDLDSGGRYDPAADAWTSTSTTGAPTPRYDHTAVWTGADMLVWGGRTYPTVTWLGNGARYALGHLVDGDGDGASTCAGDCDDTLAAIHPGAPEICDGRDDDCDGAVPPAEADGDHDGAPACGDCDDANPVRFPGSLEYCDNVDNDCDGTVDAFATTCGQGQCRRSGTCAGGVDSCVPGAPAAEICNGLDDDCNGALPANEADGDQDGASACFDCNDADRNTYPGAPEINDGRDNQCPGEAGHGVTDELSGTIALDGAGLCWPAQFGATRYEVGRSSSSALSSCAGFETAGTCWSDPLTPASGQTHFYVVRPIQPNAGSWGQASSGAERVALCRESDCGDGIDNDDNGLIDCADLAGCYGVAGCSTATFSFTDTAGDDLEDAALADFLTAVPATASDYLRLALSAPSIPDFEWCAARADFYRQSYLDLRIIGGTVISGSWGKWTRNEGGAWIGPDTAGYENAYGTDCFLASSWCPEIGLGGHTLGISPADADLCEAFDSLDCGNGTWTVTLTVGVDQLAACGF